LPPLSSIGAGSRNRSRLAFLGLATTTKAVRPISIFDEEFAERHSEGHGEAIKHVHGWVFLTPLHPAEIGAVNARIESEPFLRNAFGNADASYVPAD
jgi:hypothetical protein